MSNLHISISAEPVFYIGPVAITNSILTSWLVSILIISLSIWASKNIKNTKSPKGLQNFLEMLVEGLQNLTLGITESPLKSRYIFPFVISFFLFILLNNWAGLIPGVGTVGFYEPIEEEHAATQINPSFVKPSYASEPKAETTTTHEIQTQAETPEASTPPTASETEPGEQAVFVPYFRAGTADINTTLALALISGVSTWFLGIKFLGLHYFSRFKNPLELISEFSRIISFTFRLFGNIFAGEVLVAVMISLVPVIIPAVFIGLEVFVGVIQAFVFAMLTLIFMNLAMTSHGGEEHAAHT